jgi:hypothetical protein
MSEERQVFWQIALGGPAMFFASAFSEEELASRFAGPTPETARDFLVLRTLAEVQKYGAAARRWEAETNQHSSGDRYEALVIESLQVERAAWQRRLLEALVTFINFSTTNQADYYAHFLAVRECERQRYCGADEEAFFGAQSKLTKRKLDIVRSRVNDARARLPASPSCWYLKPGDSYKPASLREQYLSAMKLARPAEKTALGYTYQLSFGSASERLHFRVLGPAEESGPSDQAADALCGLLAIAILCRAHDLCAVVPRGINKAIMKPRNRDRPVSDLLLSRAEVGDFVLIAGSHVAEVREVRRAQFGYESYRLEFLDTETGPGLTEDWLPAPAVALFMRRRELIETVRARLAEHAEGGVVVTEEELQDCTREAVVEAWRLGLRQYVARHIQRAKERDA